MKDGTIMTHEGFNFIVSVEHDYDRSYFDDEGGISKEHVRYLRHCYNYGGDKRPGEVKISIPSDWALIDLAAATKRANDEGWGVDTSTLLISEIEYVLHVRTDKTKRSSTKAREELIAGLTPRAKAAIAVRKEIKRLSGWLNNEWWYVGVKVALASDPSIVTSLWGIESDAHEFIEDTKRRLASEILADRANVAYGEEMSESCNQAYIHSSKV